jgi:hypothetical protein
MRYRKCAQLGSFLRVDSANPLLNQRGLSQAGLDQGRDSLFNFDETNDNCITNEAGDVVNTETLH